MREVGVRDGAHITENDENEGPVGFGDVEGVVERPHDGQSCLGHAHVE